MVVWGTWEELVLGGAVLRHGTHEWGAVASELRARTPYPYSFTAEVCKAKYKDLQKRYSGCKAWFEELRKRRVAELKQALEQSEDSIGSLESKLEILKAAKGDYSRLDCSSIQTESHVPFRKSEGIESSGKETSKDGLSAGSFTQDTLTNSFPECHLPPMVLSEDLEIKPEISDSFEREKVSESSHAEKHSSVENLAGTIGGGQTPGVRKRRGKRKRKVCAKDFKEGVVKGSNILGAVDITSGSRSEESSVRDCVQLAEAVGFNVQGVDDLMGIFGSVMENERVSIFGHRLDSQKRARYKKLVRRHVDLDTLRSRISSRSITCAKELFRDLLLLANNALVFYSKRSRERKTAILLRDIVTQSMRQHFRHPSNKVSTAINLSMSPLCNPPVKPRSARPNNRKLSGKVFNVGNVAFGLSESILKPSVGSLLPPAEVKRGLSLQGKSRRGTSGNRLEPMTRRRKRGRGR